jgi:undecaprenyl-diphosphatase
MLLGASRPAAAEFSFFLAIPTMLGATTLKMLKNGLDFTPHQWGLLAVGSVVSFVVAYAVVAAFMRYIRSRSFAPFGYYRIALGLVVLLLLVL